MTVFVKFFSAAFLAAIFCMGANTVLAQDAATGAWWGCADGYDLELNTAKDSVRCIKPAIRRTQKPVCPTISLPGSRVQPDLKIDAWGKSDVCLLAKSAYGAKPACPRRFKMEIVTGPDNCVLNVAKGIVAPAVRR